MTRSRETKATRKGETDPLTCKWPKWANINTVTDGRNEAWHRPFLPWQQFQTFVYFLWGSNPSTNSTHSLFLMLTYAILEQHIVLQLKEERNVGCSRAKLSYHAQSQSKSAKKGWNTSRSSNGKSTSVRPLSFDPDLLNNGASGITWLAFLLQSSSSRWRNCNETPPSDNKLDWQILT